MTAEFPQLYSVAWFHLDFKLCTGFKKKSNVPFLNYIQIDHKCRSIELTYSPVTNRDRPRLQKNQRWFIKLKSKLGQWRCFARVVLSKNEIQFDFVFEVSQFSSAVWCFNVCWANNGSWTKSSTFLFQKEWAIIS